MNCTRLCFRFSFFFRCFPGRKCFFFFFGDRCVRTSRCSVFNNSNPRILYVALKILLYPLADNFITIFSLACSRARLFLVFSRAYCTVLRCWPFNHDCRGKCCIADPNERVIVFFCIAQRYTGKRSVIQRGKKVPQLLRENMTVDVISNFFRVKLKTKTCVNIRSTRYCRLLLQ